jgi:hypothetical protein
MSAQVGTEMVMMSTERGTYLGLSDIGTRIWELIERPRSVDELCADLVKEFDVTEEVCRTDVDALLHDLAVQGAVVLLSSSS